MNNIIRSLNILTESGMSENFSLYMMYVLFRKQFVHQLYDKMKPHFPIDHNDRQGLVTTAQICGQSKLDINCIKESFPAHEDYALTILNKFFTNTNTEEMTEFLFQQPLATAHNIESIYSAFHSRFN